MRRLQGFFNPEALNIAWNTTPNQATPIDPPTPTPTITPPPTTPLSDNNNTPSDITTHTTDLAPTIPTTNPPIIDKALTMVFPIPRDRFFSVISQRNPFNVPLTQLKDILLTPTTFKDAYYHSDAWCRHQWREATALELAKMQEHQVWHTVLKSYIPTDRKPIKNKWGFDINGIFRARLAACGYSQIPGVDFQDFYSPVVNDAVFWIVILLQLIWKLPSIILDVETAFIHGKGNNIHATSQSY
jgi:Reverse transcriptase (RNA-dependent DNA polymerase)